MTESGERSQRKGGPPGHPPGKPLASRGSIAWAIFATAVTVLLVFLALDLNPRDVTPLVISLAIAVPACFLAIRAWGLAVAWIEYTSREQHLVYLREHWKVEDELEALPSTTHEKVTDDGKLELEWQRKIWWRNTEPEEVPHEPDTWSRGVDVEDTPD